MNGSSWRTTCILTSPMFCEKSVESGPIYIHIYISETREQANIKGAKGIIKINFPFQKMSHTY